MRGVRPRSAPALLLGLLLAAAVLAPAIGTATTLTATSLLDRLPVRAEANASYDRDRFRHWTDADRDGCDTRAEVLQAEARATITRSSSSCTVRTGRWTSWLDGRTWTDAGDVDIDHQVPLAEAWGSGARNWSSLQRERYANDLGYAWSLNAVTDEVNAAKSDGDPAQWLPPLRSVRCAYAIRWMAVKYRWRLAVDTAERSALRGILAGTCGQRLLTLPPLAPRDTGTTTTSGGGGGGGGGGCDPAYPGVCIPPPPPDLDCPDVTFRNFVVRSPDPHRFDSDGDGIGCET
ncbi:MAG: HNH endonuclease family protein [Actinomycetota bacterium]